MTASHGRLYTGWMEINAGPTFFLSSDQCRAVRDHDHMDLQSSGAKWLYGIAVFKVLSHARALHLAATDSDVRRVAKVRFLNSI